MIQFLGPLNRQGRGTDQYQNPGLYYELQMTNPIYIHRNVLLDYGL